MIRLKILPDLPVLLHGAAGSAHGSDRIKHKVAGNSTTPCYSSFTETTIYGGGGGYGGWRDDGGTVHSPGKGGSPGGGTGGTFFKNNFYSLSVGQDGSRPGAGAGGGAYDYSNEQYADSGTGGSGLVAVRMHLKVAS